MSSWWCCRRRRRTTREQYRDEQQSCHSGSTCHSEVGLCEDYVRNEPRIKDALHLKESAESVNDNNNDDDSSSFLSSRLSRLSSISRQFTMWLTTFQDGDSSPSHRRDDSNNVIELGRTNSLQNDVESQVSTETLQPILAGEWNDAPQLKERSERSMRSFVPQACLYLGRNSGKESTPSPVVDRFMPRALMDGGDESSCESEVAEPGLQISDNLLFI